MFGDGINLNSIEEIGSVIEDIKNGKSFQIVEDVNILGEKGYEEYIFYLPRRDLFCRQILDWDYYQTHGWRKSILFEDISQKEAEKLIRERTNKE